MHAVRRVVEPVGVAPSQATVLDPDPTPRPGETTLTLTDLVLSDEELEGFRRAYGEHGPGLRAALLEATTTRGGLPQGLESSVLVGQVVAVGDTPGPPVAIGQRFASGFPATAIPIWLERLSDWDGRARHVSVRGHAVLGSGGNGLPVPKELDPQVAAQLARAAHVPVAVRRAVGPATRVTVLGAGRPLGACASLVAGRAGAAVTAVVASLQESRVLRALGAERVVVADPGGGSSTAEVLRANGCGLADVTIVGERDERMLASAPWVTDPDGTVLVLSHAPLATATYVASSLGRQRFVIPSGSDQDATAIRELYASERVFAQLLAWHVGIGPAPAVTGPDER